MRIPDVQAELRVIADAHGIPRIHELVAQLYRRKPLKKAGPLASPVTRANSKQVRAYVAANPDLPLREVAAVFNLDGGRVSEILRGKRT